MPILDITGRPQEVDQILEQHCPPGIRNDVLIASDMDNSMFVNDLGILVFLEKLSDRNFWKFDVDEFSSLLLPKRYRNVLEDGKKGKYAELHPALCSLALDLHADITNLYRLFQKIGRGHHTDPETNRSLARVEREFARKMLEYDRIFMRIDGFLMKNKLFRGQLLMRTRFFAGQDPKVVTRLTTKVMRRQQYDVDRIFNLGLGEENFSGANRTVSEEQIADAHGCESPYKEIDRLVVPVRKVRDMVKHAIKKMGIPAIVVTANLKGIADAAVNTSAYRFMREQEGVERKDLVIGSELSTENGVLGPRTKKEPVIGMKKTDEVLKYAGRKKRKLGMVIGDSPSTDGPLMKACLIQGGVAVIVNCEFDSAVERFHNVLDLLDLRNSFRERIYVIVPPPKKQTMLRI
jgi:hypothetical protein